MMRRNAMIAALLACMAAFFSAPAHAQSAREEREELRAKVQREIFLEGLRDCKPVTMSRCWYMFNAAGDKPTQRVWYLDLKVRNPEQGVAEIDVVEAHETDDPKVEGANDFVFYTIQYRCAKRRMRVLTGYAYMFGNRVDRAPGAGDWLDGYEDSWYGVAGQVACDKELQLSPQMKSLMWLGDYYRPIDLVDFTRRYLWEQHSATR